MSNFRTRILGLGVFTLAFAGLSFGQSVTCVTGAQTNPTLRAEGQTELLARMDTTCTAVAAPPVGTAASTGGTVYIQTSLPITSKTFGFPAVNEATLIAWGSPAGTGLCTGTFAAPTAGCVFAGSVSGNQVSFQLPGPVAAPAALGVIPTAGNAVTFSIVNIRVNASNGGAPQVTESGILSYTVASAPPTSSNTAIPASVQGAGFILKTLGPAALAGLPTGYAVCTGNGTATVAGTSSFVVNINELVSGAFLTQVGEQGQYVSGANIGKTE